MKAEGRRRATSAVILHPSAFRNGHGAEIPFDRHEGIITEEKQSPVFGVES